MTIPKTTPKRVFDFIILLKGVFDGHLMCSQNYTIPRDINTDSILLPLFFGEVCVIIPK
jgi:hypothetical protein